MEEQIRFCTSTDSVRIAYASVGTGSPLVRAAHWLTHLGFDLDSPVWRPWIREFSKHQRYIRYDERGCGLSDWEVKDFSFDAWVRDLEAVVDSQGLEKFDLLGYSQGGAVSIAYAARHPERVSHLILGGAYARGWLTWNLHATQLEEMKAYATIMKDGWGRGDPSSLRVFTAFFIPDSTLQQQRWFDELQKVSCTPENALRFMYEFGKIDVSEHLPKISMPTLIFHSRGDPVIPFDLGKQLAASIPNSRFVPLEGRNHILLEGEPAWYKFLSETRSFLGLEEDLPVAAPHDIRLGLEKPWLHDLERATPGTGLEQGERRLSAIMFTDVVGYTSLTEKNELLARQLLEEHRNLLRPVFQLHNGKEVKTVGDMFLVEFASALEAVRCAIQIQKSLSKRNLHHPTDERISLRVGIHMGEVEHSQGDVYGDAVNVASRIEPLAEPSGIVITRPVYEQIRNRPDINMQSMGNRELRNVREPLELFTVSHGPAQFTNPPREVKTSPST